MRERAGCWMKHQSLSYKQSSPRWIPHRRPSNRSCDCDDLKRWFQSREGSTTKDKGTKLNVGGDTLLDHRQESKAITLTQVGHNDSETVDGERAIWSLGEVTEVP
jgi:hypothetical protein